MSKLEKVLLILDLLQRATAFDAWNWVGLPCEITISLDLALGGGPLQRSIDMFSLASGWRGSEHDRLRHVVNPVV